MNKEQKGYALILGTLLSFAVSYFVVDYISRNFPEISVENILFWGLGGAVLSGFPFFLRTKNQRKIFTQEFKNFKKLILFSGVLTTIGAALWFWAMTNTSSGLVALLVQTGIIYSFFLGVFFLKEKVTFLEIIGFIIAIIGVILISNLKGEITYMVAIAPMLSAFMYSLQSFFIKKWGGEKLRSTVFAFQRIFVTMIFLSAILLAQGKIEFIPLDLFFIIAVSQIFGFFIGRIFYIEAHKYFPISKLNIFLALEPVIILIGGYFLFGDTLSSQKILGAVLIIGGLIFFIKSKERLKK